MPGRSAAPDRPSRLAQEFLSCPAAVLAGEVEAAARHCKRAAGAVPLVGGGRKEAVGMRRLHFGAKPAVG